MTYSIIDCRAGRIARMIQDPAQVRLVKFAINQAMDNVGSTTSVRAVGSSFITRAHPDPQARDGAVPAQPRPAGLNPGGMFKDRVKRALERLRRDQGRRDQGRRRPAAETAR